MSVELIVPSAGESITQVYIGPWHKKPGEVVQKGEAVVDLETEKATIELPAPESGRLTKILFEQGEIVDVGAVIGYIEAGEIADTSVPEATAPAPAVPPVDRKSVV